MRSKLAMAVAIGMVLSTAGLTAAQDTNTNTNTDRGNANSNRSNSNSNRGNTNRSNSNRSNSNNDNSNTNMSNSTSRDNSTRVTGMAGGTLTAMDNKFAMDMAYGNNAEIAAGRMALQKSTNPEVQRFAQMMIDHHTQANADLAQMMPGMTLPTGLHPHHQAVADGHSKLSGMDFDMAYIKGQLADHAATLDMLDSYDGKNKELKGYAKKTEPIVKQHMTMVKAMDMRMAAGMATPTARTNP